jgi:hypothetical protein
VAGVIGNGTISPGQIPRNMCQPPMTEPVKLIRQLTPDEQLSVGMALRSWPRNGLSRALRRQSTQPRGCEGVMRAPPARPAPRLRPARQRGMLRIATAAWWSLIMLRLIRREVVRATKTAVCGNWRRRSLIECGWPTSRRPDQLNAGLSPRDEVYLAGLDAEITAGLPMPLRVVLTRQLTSRRRPS